MSKYSNDLNDLAKLIATSELLKPRVTTGQRLVRLFWLLVWGAAQAWIGMLALGMLASYLLIPGLAIGFWASMVLTSMFALVFNTSVAKAISES